jgi:hypothetical protein
MSDCLVVWQDDGNVIQSKVKEPKNPSSLSSNEWARLAAAAEGYTEEEVDLLIERGFGLFLVCPFPSSFYF